MVGWISRAIEVMICCPSFFLFLTLAALIVAMSLHNTPAVDIVSISDQSIPA